MPEAAETLEPPRVVRQEAFNSYDAEAGLYEKVVQEQAAPLREGFAIVKVCASHPRSSPRLRSPNYRAIAR